MSLSTPHLLDSGTLVATGARAGTATRCGAAESIEVYLDVTAGSGTVAASLKTGPSESGPWVEVGTISAKSSGQSGVVAKRRGEGVGRAFKVDLTVATNTATFTCYAVTYESEG